MSPIFYFDYISPYSHVAWQHLKRENKLNQFQFKPLILGRVFKHWGQKPITEIQTKKEYLYKKCKRMADKNKFELELPFQHPFNTLYLLRISTREICEKLEVNQIELMDHLWDMTWVKKINVADPDVLEKELKVRGFQNSDQLLELSYEREFKNILKNNNQEAIEKGIFGVPTISYKNDFFWGFDSIEDFYEDYPNV